jgi:stress response protein YsnF
MPDEDRYTYAEAMHRGNIMVSVTEDEAHAARAEDILEKHGTVNIDERERPGATKAGNATPLAPAPGAGMTATGRPGMAETTARAANAGGEETISIVEEQLKIGKRQVSGGRVKVRSYVVETPVSEQVNLRSETVRVERRPMNRVLTAAESNSMFQDRTIDAEERDEEAVISKTARVTGEVVVKKEVSQRR